MKILWVEKQIKDIQDWLKLNEAQSFLPTMDVEDLLHKKDVECNKKILDILTRIKHHPNYGK
jgi:hypothetical protein